MKLSELGEFEIIKRLTAPFAGFLPSDSCVGGGDDCAVVPLGGGRSMVVTTDMLVEDVHFLRSSISAYELGRKSLMVNLSDISAMGAAAHSTFLSVSLPPDLDVTWIDDFAMGYRSLGVPLMGGDTTRSGGTIVINITVIGMADDSHLKFRSGARVGDRVMVTGVLGDSAAGLRAMLGGDLQFSTLIDRHHNPPDNRAFGLWLGGRKEVNAMMDISDGVSSDLGHILTQSSALMDSVQCDHALGAHVELSHVPTSEELQHFILDCGMSAEDGLRLALTGGEDYQLLLTCPASEAAALQHDFQVQFGSPLYDIGTITLGNGEVCYMFNNQATTVAFQGFNHFKKQ